MKNEVIINEITMDETGYKLIIPYVSRGEAPYAIIRIPTEEDYNRIMSAIESYNRQMCQP